MDVVFFNNNFIYQRDREREAENYAEKEAGSPPGAQYGTQSQTPGSQPESKGDAQLLDTLRHPGSCVLSHSDTLYLLIGTFSLSAFRVIIQRYELVPLCYRRSCSFW